MVERRTSHNPLAPLMVIDRLEVGPPTVTPRKVSCPYRVHGPKGVDENELVFSYQEDVLDPKDPDCLNLAAVMSAQVALNYGLFCRELVLRGPLDRTDRRFLEEAARNTAREIYALKLLQPNPFLLPPATDRPVVKRRSYVQAALAFPDQIREPKADAAPYRAGWTPDRSRHAVLSSGGKDSLLSFGLLHEIGREVHSIFINESGRHWYTALNAFRHFEAKVPHSTRVWTNADRLFTWMLRHLPFVRPDFANRRADIYPVRLWTVAVFIFAAMPLLRARGIGRLVLGDEHDATQPGSHQGISHYNGTYDQSRYFDDFMSRYFRRKRYGVAQFSLLRPLSELLIEKVLVERYPDLQALQVSCHAAHMEKDRVHPCGRCEKCRRVVGMLVALGADPKRCGYRQTQIDACMREIEARGVHQERGGVQMLGHLLRARGAVRSGRVGTIRARVRPEILKLRYDRDRSPVEGVPSDLRAPVVALMLQHAEGAVRREGRLWVDLDVLHDPTFDRPYHFEAPTVSGELGVTGATVPYLLGHLTWPEAERRLAEVDVALLPVGAVEQHGPHLPLDTDAFDAELLAQEVAAACTAPQPLVLPLVPYGVSYHHEDFKGTIAISPDTLSRLVYEVGMSIARQGITKLLIINGHGGNAPALKFAAQNINRDAHIFTAVDSGESSDADISTLVETTNDVHAGEVETSTALATRPQLVRLDRAAPFVPAFSSRYLDFTSRRSVEWYGRTARISETGVMGDPTRATAAKGQQIWRIMITNLVTLVEHLKGLTLDEIHQQRY